ncbi:S8 family serine peptidase [Pontibacter burrus]|uniref:S8 family serine peptidase n=1 Tax=Pontibacter burrus TaxID=2704466 RepID=A0A6B3LRQ2_9BACT|nr:S8 family serine peptidase [Pontibacter burrus]NEM96876.1 S8 family serine peptidase [Pontibacter burrus]
MLSILDTFAQQQPSAKPFHNRLAPGLQQSIRSHNAVRVQVKDKAQFLLWLSENNIQSNVQHTKSDRIVTLSNVSEKTLQQLANSPHVTYIDKPNRQAREEIELRDADFSINTIYASLGAFPQLNGQQMAVSIKEGAFDPNDLDLKGRAISPEIFGDEFSIHATTMATIIAGAGNTGPKGKGIAPYARLGFSDFAELFPDQSQDLLSKNIHLQNHSYGVGVENYYGLESAAYDRETYHNPTLLHVFSSGNSGDKADETGNYAHITGFANLTGQFKNSKNTLSVGAVEADGQVGVLSSRGPAYDGRVKPELVAHGKGGTSEAAAVVSGVALLAQQAYKEKYNALPPAALIKAVLINSADDAGKPQVDFETGFGNTDALGAIQTIEQARFFQAEVAHAAENLHLITVPAGTQLLKATLVWHDTEGNPEAASALINDLDLELINVATGQTWKPWVLSSYPHPDSLALPAKRRTDRLNNVEQITLELPAAGSYQLKVRGYNLPAGRQSYSLAFEFSSGIAWVYPVKGLSLQAGANNRIRWQGAGTEPARLEYKLSGSNEWQLLADNLPVDAQHYDWKTPDIITQAELRLTSNSNTATSGPFILSKQLKLNVGYNCDDQIMLHWPELLNVKEYQLWQVGSTHPELLTTTADTLIILSRNETQALPEYVSVAPVIAGVAAQSSGAIAFSQLGVACYVKRFMPEQFVAKQAALQLELSSLYKVASLTLERISGNNYEAIQTIAPVTQLNYSLLDSSPALGKNLYRVKITTTEGKAFYSHTEEILFTNDSFVQIYPNPVPAGQPFYIAIAADVAVVQLYDALGKLVYASEEFGMVKEIPTNKLRNGLYIIRIKTENGTVLSGRVLVL